MPVCRFAIDADGLTRWAGGARQRWDWSAFSAVHTYPPGLLLAMEHGAIPLPWRCLDAAQQARLLAWITAHGLLPLHTAPHSAPLTAPAAPHPGPAN